MADDGAGPRRAGARRAQVLRLVRAEREGIGVRALAEATGMHDNTVRFHLSRLVEEELVERRPVPAAGPGRPPLVYVATEGVVHEGSGNYALIAQVLSQALAEHGDDAVETATEFGRQWGRAWVELDRVDADGGEGIWGEVARADVGDGALGDGPGDGGGGAGEATREEALAAVLRVLAETGFEPDLAEDGEGGEDDPAGQTRQRDPGESVVQVHNCPFRLLAEEAQTVPCGVHRGIMEGVLEESGAVGAVTELEPFVTPHLCLARVRFAN